MHPPSSAGLNHVPTREPPPRTPAPAPSPSKGSRRPGGRGRHGHAHTARVSTPRSAQRPPRPGPRPRPTGPPPPRPRPRGRGRGGPAGTPGPPRPPGREARPSRGPRAGGDRRPFRPRAESGVRPVMSPSSPRRSGPLAPRPGRPPPRVRAAAGAQDAASGGRTLRDGTRARGPRGHGRPPPPPLAGPRRRQSGRAPAAPEGASGYGRPDNGSWRWRGRRASSPRAPWIGPSGEVSRSDRASPPAEPRPGAPGRARPDAPAEPRPGGFPRGEARLRMGARPPRPARSTGDRTATGGRGRPGPTRPRPADPEGPEARGAGRRWPRGRRGPRPPPPAPPHPEGHARTGGRGTGRRTGGGRWGYGAARNALNAQSNDARPAPLVLPRLLARVQSVLSPTYAQATSGSVYALFRGCARLRRIKSSFIAT